METVMQTSLYFCARLNGLDDTETYCDASEATWEDVSTYGDPFYYTERYIQSLKKTFATADEQQRRAHWSEIYAKNQGDPNTQHIHFALFKKQPGQDPEFAGISHLGVFEKYNSRIADVGFSGTYILRKFRGHHLADHFYKARMHYALTRTACDFVCTEIHPDNLSSRRVAERNGMDYMGLQNFGQGSIAFYQAYIIRHLHPLYRREEALRLEA